MRKLCPICKEPIDSRGIKGHLKSAHDLKGKDLAQALVNYTQSARLPEPNGKDTVTRKTSRRAEQRLHVPSIPGGTINEVNYEGLRGETLGDWKAGYKEGVTEGLRIAGLVKF